MVISKNKDDLVIDIMSAIIQLGGEAHLSEIYRTVQKMANADLTRYKDLEAQIRYTILERAPGYSVYEKNNKADKEALFYSPKRGVWGLINKEDIPKPL